MREKPKPGYAPVYCAIYPGLATIAREHGYGLAVLGCLQRDFDLVCIPWTDEVSTPDEVIKAICSTYAVRRIGPGSDLKKHGRLAHTISVGHGECALDISFMPLAEKVVDLNDTLRMDFLSQWHQFPGQPKGKGDLGCKLLVQTTSGWKLVPELSEDKEVYPFRETIDLAMRKLGLVSEREDPVTQ